MPPTQRPDEGLSTSLPVTRADPWRGWFDGAALPNPGKIGIGVLLVSPTGERFETSNRILPDGCSNEAEFHALIAALEFAHAQGARHLCLYGDSQVAIAHALGREQTQIARLLPLLALAQSWLSRFDTVQLVWLPRHKNAEADRLSRAALGLPPKSPAPKKARQRRR